MKRVVISAPAAQNLRDIGDYIATDSPARARRFVAAPKERRLRLALHPFRGKQAGIVMIDRIIHGSRDIAGHDDDL
ncbi:type II toxin-antitoxin system RelE/ParE family toxin [Methylobacterium currus]|uniref:type II toxin-antitoxin system RelE/ParE family toxin n=1 Tax=Methylobacterium currus TaxID=2051553 RepID=UPI001E5D58A4|nr:type II toxin-antitoxin system RelE/ParE family toxin [Methylobacterium currus]UHC16380.1 type II toxin-antitoxin system RelE/ParE family toxin [Methylobacterium currus]